MPHLIQIFQSAVASLPQRERLSPPRIGTIDFAAMLRHEGRNKDGLHMYQRVFIATILCGLAPLATEAAAQDTAPQLDAVVKCRSEVRQDVRLACFDRTVAILDRARTDRAVIVLDRSAVIAGKQRRFGLGSPSNRAAVGNANDRDTTIVNLNTAVQKASLVPGAAGRWNLALTNGMVWQTLEDLTRLPAPGTAITLKRSSLGGYRAFIGKQSRSVPVKRLR